MKLTWCHNRLAIGSFSQESDGILPDRLEDLDKVGITHIINCRRDSGSVRSLQVIRGVALLWNPIDDDGEPKPVTWFGRSIDFALGALASPRYKVCVFCYHGNNRSPSTALAILMAQGLNYRTAMTLIYQARPEAQVRYGKDAAEAVKALRYC